MAYISEDRAYKLWQMVTGRSWESLYNLLYNDYYEGQETGLDRDLVYQLLEIAQRLQNNGASFPATSEDFYETLNQQMGGWKALRDIEI